MDFSLAAPHNGFIFASYSLFFVTLSATSSILESKEASYIKPKRGFLQLSRIILGIS